MSTTSSTATDSTSSNNKMVELKHLLKSSINDGSPLYNEGRIEACYLVYYASAKQAQYQLPNSKTGKELERVANKASELAAASHYCEAAWVLRHVFDKILSQYSKKKQSSSPKLRQIEIGSDSDSDASSQDDQAIENLADLKEATALSSAYRTLRSNVKPRNHKSHHVVYENCFPASLVVDTLKEYRHNLESDRKATTGKAQTLLDSGMLVAVSHPTKHTFKDGRRLYRFPRTNELRASLSTLQSHIDSRSSVTALALQQMLPKVTPKKQQSDLKPLRQPKLQKAMSEPNVSNNEKNGYALAQIAAKIKHIVDVADRRHGFKTYKHCFIGCDAITAIVKADLATDRPAAMGILNDFLALSLIHHVTREHHTMQDKRLFFSWTPVNKGSERISKEWLTRNSTRSDYLNDVAAQ